MADTNATSLVSALDALSLTGETVTEEVNVPVEDGEEEECSGSENGDDKTVVGLETETVSVPAGESASSATGAQEPTQPDAAHAIMRAISSPTRTVTIFSHEIVANNGTVVMRMTTDQLDRLAQIDTDFLLYNLVDDGYGKLILTAHEGGFYLSAAVHDATGCRGTPHQTLVANFCSAEEAILAYRQAVFDNGLSHNNIPEDECDQLVTNIGQRAYGLLYPLIATIEDVVAVLGFIKSSYLELCRLEANSDQYKRAVKCFDSGVATMMLYFILVKSDYTHLSHGGDQSPAHILKWGELGAAISKVDLRSPIIGRRNTTDKKDPKDVKHRSYDYFVRLTQYVSFLGLVEQHIGWETIPVWVSHAILLGQDAAPFMITPVIGKFREAVAIPGLQNGLGLPVQYVPVGTYLQTSNRVRIGRGLAVPILVQPPQPQAPQGTEESAQEAPQETPQETLQETQGTQDAPDDEQN